MTSPEIHATPIDYADLVAPRLDAYGIAVAGVAAKTITNTYHYYASTHQLELQELAFDDGGEFVLDEQRTVDVLHALHWASGQKSILAKQAYTDARKHMKAARLWNRTKQLRLTDESIALGDQMSNLSDKETAVMIAVGVALIESAQLRLSIEPRLEEPK